MKIKELKELAEAATAGPWVYEENGISYVETFDDGYGPERNLPTRIAEYTGSNDGLFIAAANPETLLKLIAVVEAAQATIDFLNPMFVESDDVIVNMRRALKDLENL